MPSSMTLFRRMNLDQAFVGRQGRACTLHILISSNAPDPGSFGVQQEGPLGIIVTAQCHLQRLRLNGSMAEVQSARGACLYTAAHFS